MKQTTGARFQDDLAARKPLYFIASSPSTLADVSDLHSNVLVAVNELPRATAIEPLLQSGSRLFLDSGIFNLTNEHMRAHGVTMDEALALSPDEIDGFEDLFSRYCEIVTAYSDRLWGIIELDQGGAVNKRKTRARIESETGIIPIPVYHPLNDGWDYFDELASEYDRICVGNIVQASPSIRVRLMMTIAERLQQYPNLWVHYLGLTPNPVALSLVNTGSADSSGWLAGIRWADSEGHWAALQKIPGWHYGWRYEYGDPESHKQATRLGAVRAAYRSITWADWHDGVHALLEG